MLHIKVSVFYSTTCSCVVFSLSMSFALRYQPQSQRLKELLLRQRLDPSFFVCERLLQKGVGDVNIAFLYNLR